MRRMKDFDNGGTKSVNLLLVNIVFIIVLIIVISGITFLSPSGPSAMASAGEDQEIAAAPGTAGEKTQDIEVTAASRNKRKISEAPGIVSVITAEEIEAMGARDLRDVLRHVPGFELGMRDVGYIQMGIRGVTTPNSEKVKILLDGLPVNEHLEGSGTSIFSEFPLDNVARIEIVRGPASSLYGSSAFVGVISIITKNAENVNGVDVILKGGSFNTKEGVLLFGKQFKDFKIKGYVDYLETDGMEVPIEEDVLTFDPDPYNRGVSLAGTPDGHTIEGRKKITASLNLSYKGLYFKGFYLDIKKEHYLYVNGIVSRENEPWSYQVAGMLGYKFKFTDMLECESRLYSIYYSTDNFWQSHPPGYREPLSGIIYPYGEYVVDAASQRTFGADLNLIYRFTPRNTLTLGTSYENIKLINGDFFNNTGRPELTKDNLAPAPVIMRQDPTRKVYSFFIQEQWKIAKSVEITAGMRYDNYSDSGSIFSPRLALVWKPVKKATVKLLYNKGFRVPTFVELYLYALGGFLTGNIHNTPETVKTAEIQFSYDITDAIRFQIDYFNTSINDLIDLKFIYGENNALYRIEYRNFDAETGVKGIEAELKALFGKNNYGFINLLYQDGENKKTGAKLTGMAQYVVNAGFNWAATKKFNLNIAANRVGPRERAAGDIRDRLEGYTMVNATLAVKNLFKNMKLFLSVYNIFDADIRAPAPFGNLPNDFPLPNSARSFHLGLKYLF